MKPLEQDSSAFYADDAPFRRRRFARCSVVSASTGTVLENKKSQRLSSGLPGHKPSGNGSLTLTKQEV